MQALLGVRGEVEVVRQVVRLEEVDPEQVELHVVDGVEGGVPEREVGGEAVAARALVVVC